MPAGPRSRDGLESPTMSISDCRLPEPAEQLDVVLSLVPSQAPAHDVEAPDECCELLTSVTIRLSALAGPRSTTSANAAEDMLRDRVFDCVAALDRFHDLLRRQTELQRHLARELAETRHSLERTMAELAGIRAGERAARHLAMHDGLTELPNLRCLQDRLQAAVSAPGLPAGTLTLLYIDLDNFKAINDTHGHDIGDELLRIVAARLRRAVRGSDFVCRIGGDEFVCLLTEAIQHDELQRLACKLFDTVSAPLQIDALHLSVAPSIGIAIGPARQVEARGLLKRADAAMYRAKQLRIGFSFCDGAPV